MNNRGNKIGIVSLVLALMLAGYWYFMAKKNPVEKPASLPVATSSENTQMGQSINSIDTAKMDADLDQSAAAIDASLK